MGRVVRGTRQLLGRLQAGHGVPHRLAPAHRRARYRRCRGQHHPFPRVAGESRGHSAVRATLRVQDRGGPVRGVRHQRGQPGDDPSSGPVRRGRRSGGRRQAPGGCAGNRVGGRQRLPGGAGTRQGAGSHRRDRLSRRGLRQGTRRMDRETRGPALRIPLPGASQPRSGAPEGPAEGCGRDPARPDRDRPGTSRNPHRPQRRCRCGGRTPSRRPARRSDQSGAFRC